MLNICELFLSIQGESTYAGCPCIFIRLTGCNLRCSYCDTTYAYKEGKEWEIIDIMEAVKQYSCKLVCITGGEPLLQKEIYELIDTLDDNGYKILLETNGSLSLENLPPQVIKIMDIKTPGSKEAEGNLYENIALLKGHDEIKFVLSSYEDYLWAKEKIREYKLDQVCTVHLSPAWGVLTPSKLAAWMLRDNLKARLHLQMHKIIWPSDGSGV